MYPDDEAHDTPPGISAVLATHDRQLDLDSTILELAAVLDGLVLSMPGVLVFFSNGLVGGLTSLALLLLFWPLIRAGWRVVLGRS